MEVGWKDYVWVICIMSVNILFYMRKVILIRHGKTGLYFGFNEGEKLEALGLTKTIYHEDYYHFINVGIWFFLVLGIIFDLWARTPLFE
nr:hypothetical protein [Bacteroidota bacterium]